MTYQGILKLSFRVAGCMVVEYILHMVFSAGGDLLGDAEKRLMRALPQSPCPQVSSAPLKAPHNQTAASVGNHETREAGIELGNSC